MLQVYTSSTPLCETDRAVLVCISYLEKTDCFFYCGFSTHFGVHFDIHVDEFGLLDLLVAILVQLIELLSHLHLLLLDLVTESQAELGL